MQYYKSFASKILNPFVKYYWCIKTNFEGQTSNVQRIIPTGIPELTFYLNNTLPLLNSDQLDNRGIIDTQQNCYYDLLIDNRLGIFSIYFQPEAIRLLIDLPLNRLANSNIVLADINKNISTNLYNGLLESSNFYDRVLFVEKYLLKIIYRKTINLDFKRMQYTIAQINESKGLISIDKLVDNSCLSRKQFDRIFTNQIGISPKQYLKVVRFQSAIHYYNSNNNIILRELAYKCGYYDQSHFINNIKAFTGNSPKIFFKEDIISDYF